MPPAVPTERPLTRWLFRGFVVLLFVAPFPLGSNRPEYWGVLVAASAVIPVAWCIGLLADVVRWPDGMARAQWALTAMLLFLAWSALQLLPQNGLEMLPVPQYLRNAFELSHGAIRRSADVQASADRLLLSLGLVFIALSTVLLVRSKRRTRQLLWTLVLAGTVQAVYGSLMVLSGVEMGFLEPKEFGRGLATGTYINRNHFANLLVLALSAGIGLLLSQMDLAGAGSMRMRAPRRACASSSP